MMFANNNKFPEIISLSQNFSQTHDFFETEGVVIRNATVPAHSYVQNFKTIYINLLALFFLILLLVLKERAVI